MSNDSTKSREGKIIQINEEQIKDHLGEMVRGTVEETLNAMLEKEAEQLVCAERYERTEGRKDTRAGHYHRNLETRAGTVQLQGNLVSRFRSTPA
jgi:putative transposase